jgi:hypothetical protein
MIYHYLRVCVLDDLNFLLLDLIPVLEPVVQVPAGAEATNQKHSLNQHQIFRALNFLYLIIP